MKYKDLVYIVNFVELHWEFNAFRYRLTVSPVLSRMQWRLKVSYLLVLLNLGRSSGSGILVSFQLASATH